MSKSSPLTRRAFVALATGSALYASAPHVFSSTTGKVSFPDYPFKLGVASGDPTADGFVLWTRLAPSPFDDDLLPPIPIEVAWEIARDPRMKHVVRRGTCNAKPDFAHSVHVEVFGLDAATEYFYRFHCSGETSPVGRTKTLISAGAPLSQLRFAQVCCQSIHDGYYAGYRDVAEQEIDFVLHLGDYIYESDYIADVRRIPIPIAKTLRDYRALHARYKLDQNLQRAHQHAPWLSIWDDHEVTDDHGGLYSEESTDPKINLQRKLAGYRAYYEHMPLRLRVAPQDDNFQLYQRSLFGDLMQLDLLDFRQYRDNPACLQKDGYKQRYVSKASCPDAYDQTRTGLGWQQEKWFHKGFGYANATWNVFAQTTVFAPFDLGDQPGIQGQQDGWEGYAASRQRILDTVANRQLNNTVSLGGDIHAYYAGVVHRDPYDFDTAPLVNELVCTSLTSGGGGIERLENTQQLLAQYPGNPYFENRFRGYILNTVTHNLWSAECRNVVNILDRDSTVKTAKELSIEAGNIAVR